MTKIYVAMCVHRNMRAKIFNQVRLLEAYKDDDLQFEFQVLDGDAAIDRQRSRMVSHFYMNRKDCDILLFIDDDIVFSVQDFVKIIKTMLKENLGVLGATYVTKNMEKPSFTFRPLKEDSKFYFGTAGVVREVKYISTGCMAIHRKVLNDIVNLGIVDLCNCGKSEKFYTFFLPLVENIDGEKEVLSEDWAFCYRVRQAGWKIWVDCSTRLGHIGDYIYCWNDIPRGAKQISNFEAEFLN